MLSDQVECDVLRVEFRGQTLTMWEVSQLEQRQGSRTGSTIFLRVAINGMQEVLFIDRTIYCVRSSTRVGAIFRTEKKLGGIANRNNKRDPRPPRSVLSVWRLFCHNQRM